MVTRRNNIGWREVARMALLLLLVSRPAPGETILAGSTNAYAEAYDRAVTQFLEADFFKPMERDADNLSFKLAPLILHEVQTKKPAAEHGDIPGALVMTHGAISLEVAQPTLYSEIDSVALNGKLHARFTYLWFYSAKAGTIGSLAAQGIRLTLGSGGEPVIWEVLAEPSGLELIFVSHKLEAAAGAEFGKRMPGRLYAIERGTNEAPKAVVARVIEDGPVPMGPIVYLREEDKSVSTVICRCMPAQAKKLRATTSYALVSWPSVVALGESWRAQASTKAKLAFWPGENELAPRVERFLRLPREF